MFYSSTTDLTNPNNLWYAIQQYCESTETTFVAQIPEFVQAAEERIYNSVQLPAIRKTSTINAVSADPYVTLPSDWLATFSLAVINPSVGYIEHAFLLNKDVNFIRESFPSPVVTGVPQYYAVLNDNTIMLGPTPNANFPMELQYYYYPASIVTAGTTWLSLNFETALLYGCIREAYTYLKGESDLAQSYESKYKEALDLLKTLAEGKDRRDTYRSGQVRASVQ